MTDTPAAPDKKQPTEMERLAQRAAIGRMHLRRIPAKDIAEALSLSPSVVNKEIKRLKDWFKEQSEAQAKVMRENELAHLRLVRDEAWIAWEESQRDFKASEKTIRMRGGTAGEASGVNKERTEKRIGDPRFLVLVVKTTSEIMDTYGLKLPRKVALTNPDGDGPQTIKIDDYDIRGLVEEMRAFEESLKHGAAGVVFPDGV